MLFASTLNFCKSFCKTKTQSSGSSGSKEDGQTNNKADRHKARNSGQRPEATSSIDSCPNTCSHPFLKAIYTTFWPTPSLIALL